MLNSIMDRCFSVFFSSCLLFLRDLISRASYTGLLCMASAVRYADTETRMRASRCSKEPVISMTSILPVTGDFTTAAKYAAIPNTIKFAAYAPGRTPKASAAAAQSEPPTAPSTSMGRNIPPGTPEPKQSIVYIYFTTNKIRSIIRGSGWATNESTKRFPPPRTWGSTMKSPAPVRSGSSGRTIPFGRRS